MKKMCQFLGLISLVALISSCATIDKPDVRVIDNKPKISKTIQQQKLNVSNKNGIKT